MVSWKDFVEKRSGINDVGSGFMMPPTAYFSYDRNGGYVDKEGNRYRLVSPGVGIERPPERRRETYISAAPDRTKQREYYRSLRDRLATGGNGNPDEMLGKRMNPIVIAPGMAAGGVPSTAMSAINQAIAATSIAHGMEALSESHPTIAKTIAAANVGMTSAPFLTKKPVITVKQKRPRTGSGPDPFVSGSYPLSSPNDRMSLRFRDRLRNRIEGSDQMMEWESGPIIHMSDIKRYLLQEMRKNTFGTDRSGKDVKKIIKDMVVEPGASGKTSWAKPDPSGISKPTIGLAFDNDGFIPVRDLRHEVGHLLDLHGRGEYHPRVQQTDGIRYGKISIDDLWRRDKWNPETRANEEAGLPRFTPWTDSYEASSADKFNLRYLLNKYPLRKPNLPK